MAQSNTVLKPQSLEHSDSWLTLTTEGDGYLSPQQRAAFEHAISLIKYQIEKTLTNESHDADSNRVISMTNYIDRLEERFLKDTNDLSDMEQEVALTAARFVEKIAQIIVDFHPAAVSK